MNPGLILAAAAVAILVMCPPKPRKRGGLGISVAEDCNGWEIPDSWYETVAAPKYEELFAADLVPYDFDEALSFLTDNLIIEEIGSCPVKLTGLSTTDAMVGLRDHIGSMIEDGLRIGVNPFRVVKKEVFDPPRFTADAAGSIVETPWKEIEIVAIKTSANTFFAAANDTVAWPPTDENRPVVTAPIATSPSMAIDELKTILSIPHQILAQEHHP